MASWHGHTSLSFGHESEGDITCMKNEWGEGLQFQKEIMILSLEELIVLWLNCLLPLIWFLFHIAASATWFHKGGQESRFIYHFPLFYPSPNTLPGCYRKPHFCFYYSCFSQPWACLETMHLHVTIVRFISIILCFFSLETSIAATLLYLDFLPRPRTD